MVIVISTLDKTVNASSTLYLICAAYGSLSAPLIEWMSVTNGQTATIRNSTFSQVTYQMHYIGGSWTPPDHT